jgi:hypothetical protein
MSTKFRMFPIPLRKVMILNIKRAIPGSFYRLPNKFPMKRTKRKR